MASADDMGARVFYEMSAKLKRAGDGDLRKLFHKEMREAAKPLLPKIRGSAESRFPSKGGLNRHMARGARYRTVAKTGAATAGVSIRANKTDPRSDTQGRVAHPVPQRNGEPVRNEKGRRVMVVQRFPNAVGYFRDPIEAGAVGVRRDLLDALERWADDMGLR
jgi:hypothetical protein